MSEFQSWLCVFIHPFIPLKPQIRSWTCGLPFPFQWAWEANPICPPYLRLNSAISALYGFRIMRMLESKASISFLPLSCVLMQMVLPLRQWSRSPLKPAKRGQQAGRFNPQMLSGCLWNKKLRLTFVVKRAIKVIAARVEASGELDEVASPGVASSWETGEGDLLLSTRREEVAVHAAVICQRTQQLYWSNKQNTDTWSGTLHYIYLTLFLLVLRLV